jgi:MraZ protein
MHQFLGEFECKLDDKGRLRLPSQLLKQLEGHAQDGFVVNRGFEKCLAIYPTKEWQRITQEINALNLYVKKNRDFVRYFFRGATELALDSSERINFPNPLLEYIEAKKEVVLFAYFNRIEVWAKEQYDNLLDAEPSDFADLAEEVMGAKKPEA